MMPIAFDLNSCHHGLNFIRFPMELNGKYCYGSTIYSILKGAGYNLAWATLFSTLETIYLQKRRSRGQCEACVYGEEDYVRFIQTLKRYYSPQNQDLTPSLGIISEPPHYDFKELRVFIQGMRWVHITK